MLAVFTLSDFPVSSCVGDLLVWFLVDALGATICLPIPAGPVSSSSSGDPLLSSSLGSITGPLSSGL